MDNILDDVEIRIIGCLIEKEMTTPEYYPLTLNALTNACNQKSNRNPVVFYEDAAVAHVLDILQQKGFTRKTLLAGSRVPKYLHTVLDRFDLSKQEIAILCELMLRGPQTAGEIRSHAERMSVFENLEEVEKSLQGLMEQDPPLAVKLPREPGRKECRYVHLLSDSTAGEIITHDLPSETSAPRVPADERIMRLEEEIARLRSELEELRQAFGEFKAQF
jgi:uncharacterized protein